MTCLVLEAGLGAAGAAYEGGSLLLFTGSSDCSVALLPLSSAVFPQAVEQLL